MPLLGRDPLHVTIKSRAILEFSLLLRRLDSQPSSRSLTIGTYRGNNDIFSFDIPPHALHGGENTIDIHVENGKKSYPGFLSPNVVFDAIDLVTTADAKRAAATLPGTRS